jgi:hypothetical protein
MSESKAQWPPRVGDHVQIVATGSPGMVVESSEARGFLVAIYSHDLRTMTTAPRRTYTLRELGPESVPLAAVTPDPPASRRRAKTLPAAD